MAKAEIDQEIRAIETIVAAMTSLDAQAQTRVLRYVFNRLGLSPMSVGGSLSLRPTNRVQTYRSLADTYRAVAEGTESASQAPRDVRSLRGEKQPRSAVEMAALVAYYLSELAPQRNARGRYPPPT